MINNTVLTAEKIMKRYANNGNQLLVLDSISMTITEGEFIGIVGPSGCGKTTFLRILAGIEKTDSGSLIWFHDQKKQFPPLSFAFQHLALFPWLTVEENIAFPIKRKYKEDEIASRVQKMLNRFGLGGFENFYISQISGGMRQRTALARAMITEPEMLILDEPFGALDAWARLKLQDLILKTCGDKKVSVLMVTHDLHEAVRLCNRIEIFSHLPGKIIDEIVTENWSIEDRLNLNPEQMMPYIQKLHDLLKKEGGTRE